MTKAAYIKELQIADESCKRGPPDPKSLEFITDKPSCYDTAPINGDANGFFYGGPGGNC